MLKAYRALSFLSTVITLLLLSGCDDCSSDTMVVGGYVLLGDGTPVEYVEVTLMWPDTGSGPMVVRTDEDGWYSYEYGEFAEDDRLTVTPYHDDFDFDPTRYDLPRVHGDQLDLDFVAIPIV